MGSVYGQMVASLEESIESLEEVFTVGVDMEGRNVDELAPLIERIYAGCDQLERPDLRERLTAVVNFLRENS